MSLIEGVFKRLDSQNQGKLEFGYLLSLYNPQSDPGVINGDVSEDVSLKSFAEKWGFKNKDDIVEKNAFSEFLMVK